MTSERKSAQKKAKLLSIYRYPVKSMMGEQLQGVDCLEEGLAHDRRFMLVDDNGRFLTQRKLPQLSQFFASIDGDALHIRNRQESLRVSFSDTGSSRPVKIWSDDVLASSVSSEASETLSDWLGLRCHLVKIDPLNPRMISDPKGEGQVSFADGFPYLIIGTASLNHLNEKLNEPVDIRRFRPNILVETDVPHIEDEWKEMKMGSVELSLVKTCARCILTTIDPDAGTKSVEREPLKTLESYRKDQNNEVLFGVNALLKSDSGKIQVGEYFEVTC